MMRLILAALAGAVVYYIWGMVAWMVLPLHMSSMHGLPHEAEVTALLKSQELKTGVYSAPWSDNEADWQNPESEWMKRHEAGPVYSIFYKSEGCAPMSPQVMATGFAIDFVACLLVSCLLCGATSGCCRSYLSRVGFVVGMGIFAALIGHVTLWNWMAYPTDHTIAFVIDVVAGWTLTGLVLAAIIRPCTATTTAGCPTP